VAFDRRQQLAQQRLRRLSLEKQDNVVTPEKLQDRLLEAVRKNPAVTLSIQADTNAPWGRIFIVMDAAKAAEIKSVSAATKSPGQL